MNFLSLFGIDKLGLYLIGGLVILAAIIIVPNFNQISEKLGFETRTSLKVDKQQLEDNNRQLVNINTENKKTEEVMNAIEEQATKIADDIAIDTSNIKTKVETIKQKHRTSQASAPPVKTEAERIEQTSRNNITLVWDVYNKLQESDV